MRYDLKKIASGVVQVLIETARKSVKDGVEVVIVAPIFFNSELYYQVIARNEDGTIFKMPPNFHNSFAEGYPAHEGIRTLVTPGPTEEQISNKEVQGRVKKIIAELIAHDMFGLCLTLKEVAAIQKRPPLQRRKKLPSLDDYFAGSETEATWNSAGIVSVKERRLDRREGTNEKINWLISKILGDRAPFFLQFLALAVFSDRRGIARPIVHLFGARSTGKSVLAQLFKTVCGSELTGVLSARESSRRWIFPDQSYYILDENAEVDENTRKNLWGFMKMLTKTLGFTQWEKKFKQPVELEVGSYIVASTNDPLFAASEIDEVDNVIGFTMKQKLNASDLILDGVDIPEYLLSLNGIPYEFVERTLWPEYCRMDGGERFGMAIYKDAEYKDIEKSDTRKINDMKYEAIVTYCRYIKFCRKNNLPITMEVLNVIAGADASPFYDVAAARGLFMLREINAVPLCFLKKLLEKSRNVSIEAMKILSTRGVDFKEVKQRTNPCSYKGSRVLYLPDRLFEDALTKEEYENLSYCVDKVL